MNDSEKQAEDIILCPKCESIHWKCWDERIHRYKSEIFEVEIEMPVGYLVCLSCDHRYLHHHPNTDGFYDLSD